MMKDFRQQVVQHRPDESEVTDLLRKGRLRKAFRKARAAGFVIPQEDIDATAIAMFRSGRAGELLALVGKEDVKLPYDITSLLIRAFEAKDYHTFLKQVYRLDQKAKHEVRIKEAIMVIEKSAPWEASAWRHKLGNVTQSI